MAACYGCDGNTRFLFDKMKIGKDKSFEQHLNQYLAIKIDMQSFMSESGSVAEMISNMEEK